MSGRDRVLIAGGGPVGFTLALCLARRGIPVTLFEAGDKIFDDPRAGTIHPPTLELFDGIGAAQAMIARGLVVPNYQYRDRRLGVIADFDLGSLRDDTRFPFRLMLEQHKLCFLLRDLLKDYPNAEVLMRHRVTGAEQDAQGVLAHVETPDGARVFHGRYMAGCDGGRSQVRKSMKVPFEGFTYAERFLVLSTRFDFGAAGYAWTNYIADPEQWCALFRVPGEDGLGMWRVVFPTDAAAAPEGILDEANAQRLIQGFHPKAGDYAIAHKNLYDVHQRVASRYRAGRLLIAGDAAHINNPLGGMGMNFGLHDAFNLADKTCRVFDGESEDLFDLYDRQRRTVAQEFLQRQTIDNKRNIEQKDETARRAFHDELRAIAADPAALRAYLLRVAMIEGLRRANSIV